MLVVPTYNERENIGELIRRVRTAVPGLPIMFVDDNSPDGTAELIKQFQENDPLISLIERPEKLGLGSAYIQAFGHILDENLAEYIISFDADLSHQPESLPDIIEHLQNFSVVIGSRYVKDGATLNWNPLRKTISRMSNLYAQALTGLPIRDTTSGMVGYRTDHLKRVLLHKVTSEGYAFQIEMKLKLYQAGASIIERPIEFEERREGRSKFGLGIVLEGARYPVRVFLKRIL